MKIKTEQKTESRKRNYGTLNLHNTIVPCKGCGKLTHSSIDGCVGVCLCRKCLTEAELTNEHYDGYHDDGKENPDCPLCIAEKGKEKVI